MYLYCNSDASDASQKYVGIVKFKNTGFQCVRNTEGASVCKLMVCSTD